MLFNRYARPLYKYPGPFLASCTRFWLVYTAWSGHVEDYYLEIHRKYGPVVRIGPNELSFESPDAAIEVFRTGRGFHKTDFYTVFLPSDVRDIFTEIREKVHAKKKRFAVPPYSLASVKRQAKPIEKLMLDLFSTMETYADSSRLAIFDLGSWLHFFAIDVLGQFAFDRPFDFLKKGSDDDGFLFGVSYAQYESSYLGQIPILDRLTRSNPIRKLLPFLPKDKLRLMPETAEMVLKEFLQQGDSKSSESVECLMKSLLDTHQKNPEEFEMKDVMAISMGAIAAGSDTTVSTMQSFCWHILANHEVHRRLVAEILGAPLSPIIKYEEAIALPYFQACLKETMRLQPALPFNITRTVPDSGATVNGIVLPPGTRVAVSAWVMHRNEGVSGSQTDSFDPQRWLNADADRLKKMERRMFQFGGGSHVCIGRHLAMFELNKILPEMFRRFEMKLVNPDKPLKHLTRLFYTQEGLHITLKKRN